MMLDLLDRFYALIWPMLRISAFLAFTSVFPVNSLSLPIRIVMALTFTLFLSMQIEIPKLDPMTAPGLFEVFNQLFIGFMMGLMMQITTAAISIAGQSIANSMGLTMATLIDPGLGNVPVLSELLVLLGTLVFLFTGGHLIVFGILLESFHTFPIGKALMTQDLLAKVISWSSLMFVAGLLVALPIMLTLLFINIGLGFVNRAAPSLHIFSIGLPAMILIGYGVLWLAMPGLVGRINWLWVQCFNNLRDMILH
jgi:flagellar biosynthetic protein FliR